MPRWRPTALAALVLTLATASRAPAQAPAEAPAGAFEHAMSYWLADGATWRQDNADFVEGGDEARFWVRAYRWGPGRMSAMADAWAVFEDGRCQRIDDHRVRQHIRLTRADGGEMQMRDVTDQSDWNVAAVSGSMLVDGAWQSGSDAAWIRDADARVCPAG